MPAPTTFTAYTGSEDCVPAIGGATVTPHDTDLLARTPTRRLHISVAGALKVTMVDGVDVTFPLMPAGIQDLQVIRVFATGTAATGIVALY